MEAVPRLPMLCFPGRITTKPTEFGEYLKKYIREHYNEDPESYSNEINELESLRRSAVNASTDFIGCSVLKKYYCQLHFLTSRFPVEEIGIKLSFNWTSAFDHNSSESGDITYEMNSILYNVATLHTALGALDPRTTPDGMKVSCTHFQCASWVFQVLSQNSVNDGEINTLLMTFMMNFSLSQAQECILEKSMTDNRKPNIIAKVAMQVVDYLRLTLKNLESFKKSSSNAVELVGTKVLKVWQRHCDFKIAYYLAVTLFHQGLQAEEQQKMGERLAYYQAAADKLDECSKLTKGMEKAKAIGETLTFANDVIRGKLTAAQKENEFVYHEKVPPLASLQEVKGASLVKLTPFSFTDHEVAGHDIFARLVPMEAHQASSLYSEEKAKLLRSMTSNIQEKNEELEMYLASMQLDSLSFDDSLDALPQELVDCCADLNSRDSLKTLTEIMNSINSVYHDLMAKIKETEELIKREEASDKEFCIMVGAKRAPNQILIEQKRELAKYKEAHEAAHTSNQALHAAITQHRESISVLSRPLNELLNTLPSTAGVESEADKATRMEVQRLLSKIREMQTQRTEFEAQLRTNLQEDDITKQLVTNMENMDLFFKEQLDKHMQLVSILEQNMLAQNNILQALSEAYAAYGATRRSLNQVKKQRSDIISSLLVSYNAFLSITHKAEEAKEFYSKLETQVNKCSSRVKSLCKVQEEERDERLNANIKKFGASLGLGGGPKSTASFPESTTTGPKLKDFLQAGLGGRGVQADIPTPDAIAGHDYRYRNVVATGVMDSSQIMSGYNNPQHKHNPTVEVDKSNPRNYPFPPSAPSPASSSASTVSPYPSTTYYSQPMTCYQTPQQNLSSSWPVTSTAAATSVAFSYTYPGYHIQAANHPSVTSSPSSSFAPSSSSYTMVTSSGLSPSIQGTIGSQPSVYQGPYSHMQGYNLQPTQNSTSGHYQDSKQYPSNIQFNSQLPQNSVQQPSLMQINKPVSYSGYSASDVNFSSTSPSSSSSGYVSQAGVYNTTISSAVQTDQPGKTSSTYAPHYSFVSNYAANTYSNIAAGDKQSIAKSDPYSLSSAATASVSSANFVSSTVTTVGTVSTGSLTYPPGLPQRAPGNTSNLGQSQNDSTVSSAFRGQPSYNSGIYQNPNPNTAYNQNISCSVTAAQPNKGTIQHSSILPSAYSQGYSQVSNTPVTVSQYQTPSTNQFLAATTVNHYQTPIAANQYQAPYTAANQFQTPYSVANQYQPSYSDVNQYQTPTATNQYKVPSTVKQHQTPGNLYQPPQSVMNTLVPSSCSEQNTQIPSSHSYGCNTSTIQPSAGNHIQPAPYTNAYAIPQSLQPAPQGTVHSSTTPGTHPHTTNGMTNGTTPLKSQSGISNLDLLSGIDMTVSSTPQWFTLTPQPSLATREPSVAVVPDVTATTTTSEKEEAANRNNETSFFTDIHITNANTENAKSETTSAVIDLSKLAKVKRNVSVVDPLSNDETLNLLVADTERFSKFVQGLDKKSLNGPTNLEFKWNEITDALDAKCSNLKVSVGRCYPLKNRFPDNLSFDSTRVQLPSARDDYINASYVQLKSNEENIPFIVTQAPLPNTFADFWTMVWENQVETIVILNTDAEVKGQAYVPKDVSDSFEFGYFTISLKQTKTPPNDAWIQRTLQLTHSHLKTTKVVLHIQFLTWPPGAMPESPSLLLQFVCEVHSLQKQQRNKLNRVVVHCISGTGRSGVFVVLSAFIKQLQTKGSFADIWNLMIELCEQRRTALQDKTHLLFLYSAALYYAQEVLMKRGILTDKATFEEGPREKTHVRHPSADLLSSDLNRMKAKLGLDETSSNDSNLSRSGSQSSVASSSCRPSLPTPPPHSVSPSPTHSDKGCRFGSAELPPNLAASLDPNCLVLTTPCPAKPKKITKENFINPVGGLGQSDCQGLDPLSGLDPLWNLKKS